MPYIYSGDMDTQTEQIKLSDIQRVAIYERGVALAQACLQQLRLGQSPRLGSYTEAIAQDPTLPQMIDSIFAREMDQHPAANLLQTNTIEAAVAAAFIADQAHESFRDVSVYAFDGMNEAQQPDGNRYTVISLAEPRRPALLQRLRFRWEAHEDHDSIDYSSSRVLQCAIIANDQEILFVRPSEVNEALSHLPRAPRGVIPEGQTKRPTSLELVLPLWYRNRGY